MESYFSKVFAVELSADMQEHLTIEDKLQNLKTLYQYAKSRKMTKSLIKNLQHEILALTIKLEEYDEELFKEYIEDPLEPIQRKDGEIKSDFIQNIQTWSRCLLNV